MGSLLEGHIKKDKQPLAVAATPRDDLEFPVDPTGMTRSMWKELPLLKITAIFFF